MGSIEVRPSGGFKVRVWVGGKRMGDTHATREEAERQRATLAVMHRAIVEALPPEPEALTLAVWGKTWLERREELGQVRRPADDASRWRRYITGSALDGVALVDLRRKHIAAWVDVMVKRSRAKGTGRLSPQTIRHAFNLLRLALADAIQEEHITANPCDAVKLPALGGRDGWAFLSPEEIDRVMRGAEGVPAESVRAFTVAIFTGLREGELIALRWGDLTLGGPKPEVHVQRSHDGPPKNGKTRRIPLFPRPSRRSKGSSATPPARAMGSRRMTWCSPRRGGSSGNPPTTSDGALGSAEASPARATGSPWGSLGGCASTTSATRAPRTCPWARGRVTRGPCNGSRSSWGTARPP